MPTSEIEKLERRYAENPQGLTFAPLAEVHRKNGDTARALELLKAGLELHPNYIPASIVLGRCHWDLGDLPAAESAFAHVLRLDDENVIALKSLADINERLERFGDAQRWLHRLISVDRSNEEARQQLDRLELAKGKGDQTAASAPEPAAPNDLPHEIAAVEASATRGTPPPAAAGAPEGVPEDSAPLDLTAAIAEPAPASQADEPLAEKAEPKSGGLEFLDTSEPVPKTDTTYRLHPELTQEFGSAADLPERFDVETPEDVELQSSGAAEFRVPNAAEDFMDLAAPPERPIEAAPDRAVRDAKPENAAPVMADTLSEARTPSYSAQDTHGQSVAAFFQALLASRPPGHSASPAPPSASSAEEAAATRPAQDALSLSAGQSLDAALSFDDFFGSTTGGSTPLPKGGPDSGKDDLDQFQSWLQNLKR